MWPFKKKELSEDEKWLLWQIKNRVLKIDERGNISLDLVRGCQFPEFRARLQLLIDSVQKND
jgi:hypothetical protein